MHGVNAPPGGTLVMHRGALGDVLGAVPSLHALRVAFPTEPITLLTHPELGRLLARCGLADAVHDVNAAEWMPLFVDGDMPHPLQQWLATFQRIVAWVHDPDGAFARGLRRYGPRDTIVAPPFGPPGGRPHAEHLAAALAPWGIALRAPVPSLVLDAACKDAGARWLGEQLGDGPLPIAVLHPGSGSIKKNWPRSAFEQLATQLRQDGTARVVIVLGPAELERGADTVRWCAVSDAVCEAPALDLLAGIISQCAVWVGNDSGPTHLAAALGVPTVALFGAASDAPVWTPRGDHVQVIAATCGSEAVVSGNGIFEVYARVREFLAIPITSQIF